MSIVNIVVGILLLALGRKLFWLFVGCIGFVAGYASVQQFGGGQPDQIIILIALFFGLAGALLALFFQKVAIALAGFIAGGYISIFATAFMSFNWEQLTWVVYVIGGAIGAVMLLLIFDWALILISSLSGASLIVQTTELVHDMEIILFIILVIIGVIFQTMLLRQDPWAKTKIEMKGGAPCER